MSNYDMLGKLVKLIVGLPVEVIGTLYDLVEKLSGKEGVIWLAGLKRFLRKEGPSMGVVFSLPGKIVFSLLEKLGVVKVPATAKFVAKECFETNNKEVRIGFIADSFRKWFLLEMEDPRTETELCYYRVEKDSVDVSILFELGDKAIVTLTSIWELLKKQPNRETGILLTDGYSNIFYVCDTEGVCRSVSVDWGGDGWVVDARSIGHPLGRYGGERVFSRKKEAHSQSRFGEGLY